jgi:hypothetical protein
MKIIHTTVTEQVHTMIGEALKNNECCAGIYDVIISARTMDALLEKAAARLPGCYVSKFAIPTKDRAYFIGFNPVNHKVQMVRSDEMEILMETTCESGRLEYYVLMDEYDTALTRLKKGDVEGEKIEKKEEIEMSPEDAAKPWPVLVGECLGIDIPEDAIQKRVKHKPSPTAPDTFEWMVIEPALYGKLFWRTEELKAGWRIIDILKRVKVKQTGEVLAYWSPGKILNFFGVLEGE